MPDERRGMAELHLSGVRSHEPPERTLPHRRQPLPALLQRAAGAGRLCQGAGSQWRGTGWGGTAGRLKNPARSTCPRSSTLPISHFPDPQSRRYAQHRNPGTRLRPNARTHPLTQGEPDPVRGMRHLAGTSLCLWYDSRRSRSTAVVIARCAEFLRVNTASAGSIGPSAQTDNGECHRRRSAQAGESRDRDGAGQGGFVGAARFPRNMVGSRSRGLPSAALVSVRASARRARIRLRWRWSVGLRLANSA
jgi:hypothetical protein